MKEKIFRNFSLKILSALCAIVLWTIIVNIYDPTMGVTISTVPVQLINTESLTDKGYTYEITDGSKISVYVSGPKSVITDIKAADIVATADLSRITAFADYADIDVKVVKDSPYRHRPSRLPVHQPPLQRLRRLKPSATSAMHRIISRVLYRLFYTMRTAM